MKQRKHSVERTVDTYFTDGCGRCPMGGTPECKVHAWDDVLKKLRTILLDCGLVEVLKWSMPCYTSDGKNIVLLTAFKEYCAVAFFKGSLLKDAKGVLVTPGENSQAVRQIRITRVQDVAKLEPILKAYVREALEIEKSGQKVNLKKITEYAIPEEFQHALKENAALKKAFTALTPGRQRGYLLYFAGAKQSQTRIARIEKCIPDILKGIGFYD